MNWLIVLLILIAAGVFIWWLYRRHSGSSAPAERTWQEAVMAAVGAMWRWLRRLWHQLLDWRDRRKGDPGATAPPRPAAAPAPAPRRPAGPARPAPADGGAPVYLDVTPAEIPPAYGPLLSFISGFEAAEDADLMTFTRGMAAGDLATADALHAQLEHCLAGIGLDPVSIQGLADYAEQRAEHAQGAMQIWQRFAMVYREIQEFVASGGVMPKDGRFFTGEA